MTVWVVEQVNCFSNANTATNEFVPMHKLLSVLVRIIQPQPTCCKWLLAEVIKAMKTAIIATGGIYLLHESLLSVMISILHRVQLIHQTRLLASSAGSTGCASASRSRAVATRAIRVDTGIDLVPGAG